MKKLKFRSLETFGACEAILYFYEKKEFFQRVEYQRELQLSPSTGIKIHELFFEENIIEHVPDRRKVLFRLTKKGNEIAEKLLEIQKILDTY